MIVAKRVLKRAVDRNETKRQIREAFRRRRSKLGDLDIVIQVGASPRNRDVLDPRAIRAAADALLEGLLR